MDSAHPNDKVLVHYTGRLLDGRVIDGQDSDEVVELQLGDGSVLPGLEQAIVGMHLGESKCALLRAEDAFGIRRSDLILHLDAAALPEGVSPQVGEVLTIQNHRGKALQVEVTEVTPKQIVLDGNHPLAGHDLTFDIELLRILDVHPTS